MGYVSKDFIHEGCGLPLQPDLVWESIPYSVQKNIKKAERNNVRIEKVSGNEDHISILKGMWYDPEDPNMPNKLTDEEFMFIAYHDDIPIGATILLAVGNHLFLNNLAGNKEGKKLRVQDYLLWHCVNHFQSSRFKYIDVGVSYRPTLYRFFTKWKVWSYPVLFNVPEIKVQIPFYPFDSSSYSRRQNNTFDDTIKYLQEKYNFDKLTFVPNSEYAVNIINQNGYESFDATYLFTGDIKKDVFYIDLKRIFTVQFGCLIIGLEIPDKDMWNKYGCLDVFKREFVLSSIYDDLKDIELLIQKRNENYNFLRELFSLEDIQPEPILKPIPDLFVFEHEQNERFSLKLKEFEIEHTFKDNKIGLPIHQNLSESQLEYMYAVFRGVLNLCSEWEHTDKYDKYKS